MSVPPYVTRHKTYSETANRVCVASHSIEIPYRSHTAAADGRRARCRPVNALVAPGSYNRLSEF